MDGPWQYIDLHACMPSVQGRSLFFPPTYKNRTGQKFLVKLFIVVEYAEMKESEIP